MRSLAAAATLILVPVLAGCGPARGESDAWGAFQASPPEGTRWVGSGQVVVAVPKWWTTGETRCYAPLEDTVYFDQGAIAECADGADPDEVREVSALAVLDAGAGYGELQTRSMRPIGQVDGHEVLERDGCERWFEGVCRRMFAVPSMGVVFAVTIAEAADGSYTEIRDSLRVLPDGLTTVPLATTDGWTPTWGAEPVAVAALEEALEQADLRVEVVTAEPAERGSTGLVADLPAGSLLDVQPALGSVIEVGGTVTITVAGQTR